VFYTCRWENTQLTWQPLF